MADIIKLNVGGCIYTTSRSTLTRYPNSMLGVMFSGSMPTATDKDGNYWIDGNGDMFRYVLDYLRRGQLLVPEKFDNFDLLEMEADFYQMPELIQSVKENKSKNIAKHVLVKIIPPKRDEYSPLYSESIKPGTATVFGPKYAIQQMAKRLQSYSGKNEKKKDIIMYKVTDSKITVSPFPCKDVLSKSELMLEICNLGFEIDARINDPVAVTAVPTGTPSSWPTEFWFVKDK